MALFWRIWVAVTFVNLVVLTIFVGLATLQFGNINSDLVGERLAVLAERTAGPFKAAAKIGLPLSTVRNAEALLERARQTDEAIHAIHVFDNQGRIVQSTDKPPPADIPARAMSARSAAGGNPWHIESGETFLSSIDIVARDHETVGGVLIVYPKNSSVTNIRAMAAELAFATIVILFVGAVLSLILLRLGIGKQIRLYDSIDSAVTNFERGAWRSAAGRPSLSREGDSEDLGHLLETAEMSYQAAGRVLCLDQKDSP
jgi:sensor histidine kinase regulating citrate/malate metabolism